MSPRNALLLAVGVLAVSFSAPMVRLAGDAEVGALAIAFYRNLFASLILLPLALRRHGAALLRLPAADRGLLAAAGACLALHFATWIPSVSLTSVAASTVLVTVQPVFVALGARLLFGERVPRMAAAGIAVALAGTLVISGADFGASTRAFAGDLLALSGAVFAAAYFLTGRTLRRRLSLLGYVGVVYPVATLLLVPAMVVAGEPFLGYEPRAWLLFALMALGPQILGHTTFNYLLRDVDVTLVAVGIMGEPVGATLITLAMFGEVPSIAAVVGGLLILAGIYLAVTAQSRRSIQAPLE